MQNFIQELQWRGMIQDCMPETEEHLLQGVRSAYVGIDPTADSLHIGHLVGGATGMIGFSSFVF